MEDQVTISRKKYEALRMDSKLLAALLQAGVDNWEGWDTAEEILESMKED